MESQQAVEEEWYWHGTCDVGHQGLFFNKEWGWYDVRTRPYDPITGRFPVRDSQGYVDGMNLYEYERSNPVTGLDP